MPKTRDKTDTRPASVREAGAEHEARAAELAPEAETAPVVHLDGMGTPFSPGTTTADWGTRYAVALRFWDAIPPKDSPVWAEIADALGEDCPFVRTRGGSFIPMPEKKRKAA